MDKTDSRIFSLLKILLGACLATPLLMSALFLFPYTAPKAFAFRILVELAAVCYLYLALKYPERFFGIGRQNLSYGWKSKLVLRLSSKTSLGIQKTVGSAAVVIAVFSFLAVNFLSAVFGLDFYHSFWGNLERMAGIWGLLHFVAWFFMLGAVFQTKKGWEILLKVSVATSALVAFPAILQKFFGLGDLLPQTARVFSTIGNPAFLGTYLLFNMFFAGYLAISGFVILSPARSGVRMQAIKLAFARDPSPALRRGRDDKTGYFWLILYSLFIILDSFALLFTGTRGAYLGLLVGGVVFLGLLFFALPSAKKGGISTSPPTPPQGGGFPPLKGGKGGCIRGRKKFSVVFLLAIVIFGGSLFLARNSSFVKDNSVLARLTSISLSDKTIQSRLILWQDSWRIWQARPILGYGAENFEAAASPRLSARLFSFEAFSLDRAHNFIFDYGVASGWLGLAAYFGLFAVAFWQLKKITRVDFCFAAVFGGLLAAYLVQNLFVFDSFVSYLMLFFALGVIYAATVKNLPRPLLKEGRDFTPLLQRGVGGDLSFSKKFILLVFAVLVIFSLYSFNIKPLRAASAGNQLLSWPSENQAQIAPQVAEILSLNTFAANEIVYQATIDYLAKVSAGQLTLDENFYKVASGSLVEFIRREPAQSRNYIALAWLNLYFSDNHQERIGEALALAAKARELNPNKKDVFFLLTAGYVLSGEPLRAQEIVLQAEAIDAKMGGEVREYWEKLK